MKFKALLERTSPRYNIYCITNTVDGKRYIGVTREEIERRMQHHVYNSGIRNSPLYKAMREEGPEKFKINLVATAPSEKEMYKKEEEMVKKFNTVYPYGYNEQSGGVNYKMSDESTKKRVFKPNEVSRIVSRYKAGTPIIKMAKQYGVNDNTISRMIQRMTEGFEPNNQKLVYRGIRIENWNRIKEEGYLYPRKDIIHDEEEPAVWFTPNLGYAVYFSGGGDNGVVVAMPLNKMLSEHKCKRVLEGSFWDSVLVFDKISIHDLSWVKHATVNKKTYSYDESLGDTLYEELNTGNDVDEELLYHGSTIDKESSILATGLEPSVGEFIRDAYGNDVDVDDLSELVFAADYNHLHSVLTAIVFHIAKKLHKDFRKVTIQELKQYGLVVVLDKKYFRQRPDDEDDGNYPITAEPGDYYSHIGITPIKTVKGEELLRFFQHMKFINSNQKIVFETERSGVNDNTISRMIQRNEGLVVEDFTEPTGDSESYVNA